MKIPKDVEFLFNQTGAKKWLNRPREQRANAILPLTYDASPNLRGREKFLFADDPRALAITEELSETLNKEFPIDTTPEGFCGPTAIPGDFNVLRNVSGVGMNPLPIPLTNNASFIKESNLASGIRKQDEPILAELVRLFFGAATPTNLHIRKAASFSFPYFATENDYKKKAVLQALRDPDHFLDLMTGGPAHLKKGMEEYHAMLIFAIHERQQPNAILFENGVWSSKGRSAPSEAEAREGRYLGKTIADMTARDYRGNVIEGHFAMRRRDVFGASGVTNYFLTAIIGCFRTVYLNRFEFTYKVRGSADKAERASRYKYIVGSDVKTMDKLIPEWFLHHVLKLLEKYLDGRVVELMRRAYQAPFAVPPPWGKETPDTYNPVFGGHPFDPDSFRNHPGLPSGIAFNPDWGKLWMTFVYMVLYRDIGAITGPEAIESLLQGRNPDHALLDMSDDAAFLTNKKHVADALKTPKSPYCVLEVETPVIYLGDVFTRTSHGIDAFPNPLTYLANAFCREDSIEGNQLAWADGYIARQLVYSRTPTYRDLLRIVETTVRKHTGVNPTLIAQALASKATYNDIDAMVKANPAVLHYKVDPATVSKEMLNEIVATIPSSDFFSYIKHLFRVPMAQD